MTNATKNISREEMEKVLNLAAQISENGGYQEALQQQFGENADAIAADLHKGTASFFNSLNDPMDAETFCNLLYNSTYQMSPLRKNIYLTNLLLAVYEMCGNVAEGAESVIQEQLRVLGSIKNGVVKPDDQQLTENNKAMTDLLINHYEYYAVMLAEDSPYETLLATCKVNEPENVRAAVVDARQHADNFAAALYILQEQGELPSLGEQRLSPYDLGVMTAGALEMDNAFKDPSWENAKSRINGVARALFGLLISSPTLLMTGGIILSALAIFTNLSLVWLLIGGALMIANMVVQTRVVNNTLQPFINNSVQALDSTLDDVRNNAIGLRTWFNYNVLPRLKNAWQAIRAFIDEKIIAPAKNFVSAGAVSCQPVMATAGTYVEAEAVETVQETDDEYFEMDEAETEI